MLNPRNLLSIIRTFSIWLTASKGKVIRIVGRYQQFRAVKKTVDKLLVKGYFEDGLEVALTNQFDQSPIRENPAQ